MGALLLGAVLTTQLQRPEPAEARPAETTGSAAAPSGPLTLDTFKDIASTATRGVVNISTRQEVERNPHGGALRDFFGDDLTQRFFDPRGRGRRPQTTLGSGFVIDDEGYILTNRHVVDNAETISVTLNGDTLDAELVGRDARTDVALLKIKPNGTPLEPIPLGDSDRTEVGEWVMAIGNPFGLGGNSVTVGVVSFKGRPLALGDPRTRVEMIQTDASINPGNSGGPLLNTRGEVIGINTMIMTQGLPQSAGVGFAVPINVARDILSQLRDKGMVVRGWLGVQINTLSADMAQTFGLDDTKGAAISEVTSGSPADRAGLRPEDIVLAVDDHQVEDSSDLSQYIAALSPGDKVTLHMFRSGKAIDVEVTLGTFPEEDGVEAASNEPATGEQLGMTLQDVSVDIAERLDMPSGSSGAVVLQVEPGEPADTAGLRRGDVIVSVNGNAVAGTSDFSREIEALRSDGLARLRVWRAGSYLFVILRLT
jgi:serine protease Do